MFVACVDLAAPEPAQPRRVPAASRRVVALAREGMPMLVVTHGMEFARQAAYRGFFMDTGRIVEQGAPDAFFDRPRHERTRHFLSQILAH